MLIRDKKGEFLIEEGERWRRSAKKCEGGEQESFLERSTIFGIGISL